MTGAIISINGVVGGVLYLLGASVIFWLLNFLIDYFNPQEPWKKFAKGFLLVAAVLILIEFVLGLMGHQIIVWR